MYEKTITLRPTQPNMPLDPVWIMRYAAGKMLFSAMPADVTSAVLVLMMSGAVTPVVLAVDLTDPDVPEIILENGVSATVGQGDYYIYGFVGLRIYGLGKGQFNVISAPTLSAGGAVTAVGNSLPVYNPTTGLYHVLTATANELGEVTIDVAQEGTEL